MSRKANLLVGVFLLSYVALFWGIISPTSSYVKAVGLLPLAGLAWLQFRRRGKSAFTFGPVTILLFAMVVYSALLLFVAPLPQYSLESVLLAVLLFLVFAMTGLILLDPDSVSGWEDALIWGISIFALVEMIAVPLFYLGWVETGGQLFPLPPVGLRLPGALLGGPNHIAALINLIIPLMLVKALAAPRTTPKISWVAAGLFYLTVEYYTSSRAGWISGLAAILVVATLFYLPRFRKIISGQKNKFSFSVGNQTKVAIALGITLMVAIAILFSRQVQVTPGHRGLLSGRPLIWSNAINIWARSPLLGSGLDSFPVFYVEEIQAPPGWLPNQAHNLLLQLGVETGLAGLALVSALALFVARAFLRAWRLGSRRLQQRARLASYAGVGAAVLVNGLADYAFDNALYAVAVLIILGLILAQDPQRQSKGGNKFILPTLIAIGILLLTFGSWYDEQGRAEFQDGLASWSRGEQQPGKDQICSAAATAPGRSFYNFQCAMAGAYLAYLEDDFKLWGDAEISLLAGLEKDHYWSVHDANLANVYWYMDESDEALLFAERALAAAPKNALFAFNLGMMQEKLGDRDSAQQNFVVAIQNDPWMAISPYFLESDLPKYVWDQIDLADTEETDLLKVEAYWALQSEDFQMATAKLEAAQSGRRADAEIYALTALLYQHQREADLAWTYAQTAVFLDGETPRVLAWAAAVAEQQGRTDQAREWRERAFRNWALSLTFSKDFYVSVYHRSFLPFDLAPGFYRPDATKEMVNGFVWLAEYYDSQGMHMQAEEIDFWLQASSLK